MILMRIVSLLPSATETLCFLGLTDQLVGVTHECDFPESVRSLPKVTTTHIPLSAASRQIDHLVRERRVAGKSLYSLDEAALAQLKPDLIVTQTLCGVCAVDEREVAACVQGLSDRPPRVLNLEPRTLEDVLGSIRDVARAAGVSGEDCIAGLRRRIEAVALRSRRGNDRVRTLLLEWLDPPFTCGHWNPQLVELAGGQELLGQAGSPSRTTSWEEVAGADAEVMLISCCGFTAERAIAETSLVGALPTWRKLRAVASHHVYVADGSAYFSRPGPRLVDSLEILAHVLDPDRHPPPPFAPPAMRLKL